MATPICCSQLISRKMLSVSGNRPKPRYGMRAHDRAASLNPQPRLRGRYSPDLGVQDQIHEQAKGQPGFQRHPGDSRGRQHLVFGRPEAEIHRIAEVGSDLIVVGSRPSRPRSPPGSTANSVLHGARRDVLAVRVGEVED